MIERTTILRDGTFFKELVNDHGKGYTIRSGKTLPVEERVACPGQVASTSQAPRAPAPASPIIGEKLPSAPFVAGSETSHDAAVRQEAKLKGDELRVLRLLKLKGEHGATCDECEVYLDLLHQTCAARLRGLELSGHVLKTTRKRHTRTGNNATVYVLSSIRQEELPFI